MNVQVRLVGVARIPDVPEDSTSVNVLAGTDLHRAPLHVTEKDVDATTLHEDEVAREMLTIRLRWRHVRMTVFGPQHDTRTRRMDRIPEDRRSAPVAAIARGWQSR
jgi:hypothetical protein